jgi:hypothetical protein
VCRDVELFRAVQIALAMQSHAAQILRSVVKLCSVVLSLQLCITIQNCVRAHCVADLCRVACSADRKRKAVPSCAVAQTTQRFCRLRR